MKSLCITALLAITGASPAQQVDATRSFPTRHGFLVAVSVDGDPASRPSNLRLEKEYLEAIAEHVSPSTSTVAH